jgi:hypothetical protein
MGHPIKVIVFQIKRQKRLVILQKTDKNICFQFG